MDPTLQPRFSLFCKGLSLDENSCEQCMKLFNDTKHLVASNVSSIGHGTLEEVERYWFAFVVFIVKKLGEKKNGGGLSVEQGSKESGVNLCRILRSAKLNIVDFFKELQQFCVRAGSVLSSLYSEDWESRLEVKALHTDFVHLGILSKHYKRAYQELFLSSKENVDKQSSISSETSTVSDYHRFGWMLFLALRVHAFSRFKDLVTCTNGLASVLAILILHVPVHLRNFKFSNCQWFVKKGDKGVDLLASLCNKYDTSEEELRKTMQKTSDLIQDILKKKPSLASENKNENLENLSTEGLLYFDDLMVEGSLQSSLDILEKDYNDAICNKGELDERVFINEEDSILVSGSQSGGAMNTSGSKRKFDVISSPTKTITSPLSPYRSPASHANGNLGNSKMAATPVSTAMTTAKWLRTIISPLLSKPSPQLERFFASCGQDITNDIIRRAHIILEAIFPSNSLGESFPGGTLQGKNLMDNIWAEQRRPEALKLYYRVLEAMCTAESQIFHTTNLTSLLTNERFHRCMLAVSAELVLATHKTVTMLFPAVLERTGITAYDLSKVIESFIRHEESLPRELRRHLNSLEERLLESLVWEKGSSMYNSLAVGRSALSGEINHLGLLAEPMPSLDAIATHINFSGGLRPINSLQMRETSPGLNGGVRSPKRLCTDYRSELVERNSFTSPVKDRLLTFSNLKSKLAPPALQSAFASPTLPNPASGGETYAETEINIIFSKINKLAAVRINGMIERLQMSHQHIRENVYHLFQQVLNHQTALFYNRHIDQIMLCCIYGIAKISKVNLNFNEIVHYYRKQPQCKPQVFRSVFVDWLSVRHSGRTGQDHVDIIIFYNEIFIPLVKPLLMEVASAGTSTKENRVPVVNNNREVPCPASPRVTPFPSLPDMSPKKISTVHNVYVSPLRSSKMDALVSHSSKSYYACVGESTRAYQSPSKDLTNINNRLNSNPKARVLKFEDVDVGLVTDSMATNIFYDQNEHCVSSSGAPLKSEQSAL